VRLVLFVAVALAAGPGCARAQKEKPAKLERLGPVAVSGEVGGPNDVSGAAFVGDLLLLVSNESAHVEVLKKDGPGYKVGPPVALEKRKSGAKEHHFDLEAVAADGDTVYAVGSHGRVRVKPGEVALAPHRDQLFRFTLKPDGTAGEVKSVSLRPAIEASATLKPFAALPGKEGGVNIEGLAARDGKLFVGFRSPVLEDDLVPVMVTTFDKPEANELRFVRLGGRGVRDLAAVRDGFLILAGPANDEAHGFQIYLWDGADGAPGANPTGKCELLCKVPHEEKEHPEGLAVIKEDATAYELLIVCDGPKNGSPTRYRLRK
jgi:hypothetical protein